MIRLSKIVFFILILTATKVWSQPGNWEIVGNMPLGISGASVVVVDSSIYVLGGYSDSLQNDVDWIFKYNPRTNQWNLAGHMLVKRENFISDKIGSKIYSVCGESNYPQRPNGLLEVFDCTTGNSSVLDSNMLFIRNSPTGLINDSILYIIGGSSFQSHGGGTQYILEYNIPSRSIIYSFQGSPGMREEQMSVFLNNSIYLFGGLYNTVTKDILNYNIKDHNLIQDFPGLLKPRSQGVAIRIPDSNQVVIMGGYDQLTPALNTVEIYQIFDSTHVTGRTLASTHFRRTNFMATYFDNSIYIFGGENEFREPVDTIEKLSFITGINDPVKTTPSGFNIDQNYPNPFNPTTTIGYNVGEKSSITIRVYDMLGKEVLLLINENKNPGYYSVSFNGSSLPSGVYFYRITAVTEKGNNNKDYVETRKMILLK